MPPPPDDETIEPTEEATRRLRVLRGAPTPEELAAIAALVTAGKQQRPVDRDPVDAHGRWTDPSHAHQRPIRARSGGWAASRRPR